MQTEAVGADVVTDEETVGKAKPIGITLRLTPAQYAVMRRIAYERHVSIHSLVLEGVAEVMRRHGR